ncbi:hypothetical protein COHA_005970 [Chlorella ohadii]|uniref:Uncharacterized protein n=1 Tax=Chlorella ohadii TaxID=2649997 RepID=A0AAD5H5K3_9CHLO|nr:hypothetical protein COHA_005970 [Chlorella ohadii]
MLTRRALSGARSLLNGEAASLAQGFARQQQWQQGTAAAAACPPSLPSGLRWHSEIAERPKDQPEAFEYVAPFGTAVGRVKKLSLFSCACALGAAPVIMGLDAGTTMTAKTSIVATLATFGVFTTGLHLSLFMFVVRPFTRPQLTWFTQPYVQRLRYDPATDTVEATTLSLLAQPRTDRFHLNEVTEADSVHPLTSFAARGRKYYVDAQNFPNQELLVRGAVKLVPQAAAAHAVEAANAEQQQQQQQQQQSSEQQQQAPPQ